MKNEYFLYFLLLVCSFIIFLTMPAQGNDSSTLQIQWAPTLEDVLKRGDVKMLLFFEAKSGGMTDFEDAYETARFAEPEKIERIMVALDESQFCKNSEECAYEAPAWMGIVDSNNQGVLIRMAWNHRDESVEWAGMKSLELYNVLYQYGVIQPPAKNLFVNEPDAVFFEKPPIENLPEKPKVISFIFRRDLEQVYTQVNPNSAEVYIRVDPNTPKVYIAVDPNSAQIYLSELLPGINTMIEKIFELMIQNKWLSDSLNQCLNRLESQADLPPLEPEEPEFPFFTRPSDSNDMPYEMPKIKPLKPTGDLRRLITQMNFIAIGQSSAIYSSRENIFSFTERFDRLGIASRTYKPQEQYP